MNQLSPRQAAFVTEYLKSDNATQAAIRAGYGAANADVTAARLLKRRPVREAIEDAKADLFALFRQESYQSLRTLVALRDDPDAPDSVRLRAAQDLLDRAGYNPTDRIESTVAVEQNTVNIPGVNALLEALGFGPVGMTLPTIPADTPPPEAEIAGETP